MYRKTRSEGFGAEVKRRILLGTYVLSAGYYDAYYRRAQKVRTLLRRDFEQWIEISAFNVGFSDVYTVSANLAGIPGLSAPCGFADGMPVGLQLLGPPLDEATLLRVADAFQRRTDWHTRRPAGLL